MYFIHVCAHIQPHTHTLINNTHTQVTATFGPELDALFRTVIFSYSIWINHPTPGSTFQNLIYTDASAGTNPSSPKPIPLTRRQRVFHALLNVLIPWMWARAGHVLSSWGWGELGGRNWRKKVWIVYQRTEAAFKHICLANFLLFLANGRYRTVSDRLVKMRMINADATMTRALNLDYVSHFLAWQSFIQFLNFLRPIISRSAPAVRRHLVRLTGWRDERTHEAMQSRPEHACQVCGADPPNMPHVSTCQHVFCYYCLRANMLASPGAFVCPRCNVVARVCEPLRAAVAGETTE
jgi:peroxin-2